LVSDFHKAAVVAAVDFHLLASLITGFEVATTFVSIESLHEKLLIFVTAYSSGELCCPCVLMQLVRNDWTQVANCASLSLEDCCSLALGGHYCTSPLRRLATAPLGFGHHLIR